MKIGDRTFIVSGSSSGLGLATAELLLESGAYIAVLDLAQPPPTLPAHRVKFFQTDITKLDDIERAVGGAVQWATKTGAPLGGVVNCAGVGPAAKIIDSHGNPHSLDLWDFTIAVNLTGTFNLTRLALPHLVSVEPEGPDGERGVVIFVSSSAAYEGQPGQTAYAASKGALNSMVLPLARDLGRHGVRVVSIAPGPFASPMTVGKLAPKAESALLREIAFPARFGLPRDFAQTVRWILECAYVNGEVIRLSGAGRMPGRL